jgi:hypothetical protein
MEDSRVEDHALPLVRWKGGRSCFVVCFASARSRIDAVMQAMLKMVKLDVRAFEDVYRGASTA